MKLGAAALVLVVIHASMAQKVLSVLEYGFIVMAVILLGYRGFLYKKSNDVFIKNLIG